MNKVNKKAFTIVELLVAVGLLAAMMAASMVVFRVSINAQQSAAATGDYMRTIAAVTTQLKEDYSSIDTNAPFAIWFNRYGSDSVYFFNTGRFEQLSGGNLDATSTVSTYGSLLYGVDAELNLLRGFDPVSRYQDVITPSTNSNDERDLLFNEINSLLFYNENVPASYNLLLSNEIESFKIQILYGSANGTVRWYPDDMPYYQFQDVVTGASLYSDFDLMAKDSFGVFFNIDAADNNDFYPPQDLEIQLIKADVTLDNAINFDIAYKPLAFKFTITIKDADGKLDPKVFTYVVDNQ